MTEQTLQALLLILDKYGYPIFISIVILTALGFGVRAVWQFVLGLLADAKEERIKSLSVMAKYVDSMDEQNKLLSAISVALATAVNNTNRIPSLETQAETIKTNLDNLKAIIEIVREQNKEKARRTRSKR